MGANHMRGQNRGFSFVELLIIIAIIAIIAGLLLPALARAKSKSIQVNCMNNLRQVAIGFRLWSDDNNDLYPMRVLAEKGGAKEAIVKGDVFRVFQCMSNELSTPKILVCPADTRQMALNFESLRNANVSYFVGMDAEEANPRIWLAGDRNLEINGMPAGSGKLISIATAAASIAWTPEIHQTSGSIGMGDGAVQIMTTVKLQSALQDTGTNTLRLAFP